VSATCQARLVDGALAYRQEQAIFATGIPVSKCFSAALSRCVRLLSRCGLSCWRVGGG
jgi:hypothetical protein